MTSFPLATLCDSRYLARALAMRQSLLRTGFSFQLHILCLDAETAQWLSRHKLPGVSTTRLTELEKEYPELLALKRQRNWAEYIFTLSPYWPLFLLRRHQQWPMVVTMDADLFFFASPQPVIEKMQEHSISITPHRLSPAMRFAGVYGTFNVSFQGFKNNTTAMNCLERWRRQCKEWCFDRLEDGRFADQKYLDEWPSLYGSELYIIEDEGAGLAPWNVEPQELHGSHNAISYKGEPLYFYHFHRLRFATSRLLETGLGEYFVSPHPVLLNKVYAPYISAVRRFQRKIGILYDGGLRFQRSVNKGKIRTILFNGLPQFFINRNWLVTLNLGPWYKSFQTLLRPSGK